MARSPLDPHRATPAELQQRLAADRTGLPYMLFRDGDRQEIHTLDPDSDRVAIGRGPRAHITVAWDAGVSWTHAVLDRVGDEWVLADHGLSTNGTYVNNERVAGQRRLRHGDLVRLGSTLFAFCSPPSDALDSPPAATTERMGGPPQVSDAQRRVLTALCRPYVAGGRAYPATNQEIAAELHLSRVTVKGHLRALSELFEIGQLPQNQKRAELMHRALETGAVTSDDYI